MRLSDITNENTEDHGGVTLYDDEALESILDGNKRIHDMLFVYKTSKQSLNQLVRLEKLSLEDSDVHRATMESINEQLGIPTGSVITSEDIGASISKFAKKMWAKILEYWEIMKKALRDMFGVKVRKDQKKFKSAPEQYNQMYKEAEAAKAYAEQKKNPPVYAALPYKNTDGDLVTKAIKKTKEKHLPEEDQSYSEDPENPGELLNDLEEANVRGIAVQNPDKVYSAYLDPIDKLTMFRDGEIKTPYHGLHHHFVSNGKDVIVTSTGSPVQTSIITLMQVMTTQHSFRECSNRIVELGEGILKLRHTSNANIGIIKHEGDDSGDRWVDTMAALNKDMKAIMDSLILMSEPSPVLKSINNRISSILTKQRRG